MTAGGPPPDGPTADGPTDDGPTAAVVVIGDEILSGRTRDANLPLLAQRLGEVGIRVAEARVVADDVETIAAAVNALRARHAYVFTTGGIGPTHDDLTAAAIARAFAVPVVRHDEAERRLRAYYDADRLNAARLKMADMPMGAALIDNPVSAAPGFWLENVYVLPGVPKILEAMVTGLVPRLTGGPPTVSRALTVFCAEGELAEALAALQAEVGKVALGSYPFARQDRFGTTVVARGTAAAQVEAAVAALTLAVEALGFEHATFDAAGVGLDLPRTD